MPLKKAKPNKTTSKVKSKDKKANGGTVSRFSSIAKPQRFVGTF